MSSELICLLLAGACLYCAGISLAAMRSASLHEKAARLAMEHADASKRLAELAELMCRCDVKSSIARHVDLAEKIRGLK